MEVTLIHGEALAEMDKLSAKGITVDVIVTDPPFNIGYKYNSYKDRMIEAEYYRWLKRIISDTPCVIIHYQEQLHRLSIELGYPPEKVVSWVYNSNTAKQHRCIAFYNVKPDFRQVGQPYKNPTDKRIAKRILDGKTAKLYDWWNENQVKNTSKAKTGHPCQMPEKVMDNIIGVLPKNLTTVLDPFMGSGTTGVACKKLNRGFIGIEMDKEYFAIAKKRCDDTVAQQLQGE